MMDYYLSDIRTLPDPKKDAAALAGIPPWRCEYILRYRFPDDRKRSLGAWRLMEKTLGQYGFSASNVKVGEKGKLLCEGVYFNLSHSGDFVLCVISDAPVGCDIERVNRGHFSVAERVFTSGERRYLDDAQSDAERNRRFFRLWTMKESYLKMTGEGLGVSPNRLEIDFEDDCILRDSVPQPCRIQNIAHDDYEISLCTSTE